MVLRRTLEQVVLTSMHPRLGITVVVQIVSADGSAEACAANAACAALLDAGVPMRGVLCAAACAILPGRAGHHFAPRQFCSRVILQPRYFASQNTG
jgi:ribonuclease PH